MTMDTPDVNTPFHQVIQIDPVSDRVSETVSRPNPYRLSKSTRAAKPMNRPYPCLSKSLGTPDSVTSSALSRPSFLSTEVKLSFPDMTVDNTSLTSTVKVSDENIMSSRFDALESKLTKMVQQNVQMLNSKFESALVDLSNSVLQTMKAYHVHSNNDLVTTKVEISNQIQQSHQSVLDQQVQMISKFADMVENTKSQNSNIMSHSTSTTSMQSISTQTSHDDSSTKSVKSVQIRPDATAVAPSPKSAASKVTIPREMSSSHGLSEVHTRQISTTTPLVKINPTLLSELPRPCNSCKQPVTKHRKGIPYPKCQPCYLKSIGKSDISKSSKSKTSKSKAKKHKPSNTKSVSYSGGQKSNCHPNHHSNGTHLNSSVQTPRVNSFCNFTARENPSQKNFQIPVNVTNSRKSKSIKGILDLSRSTDIISLRACEDLGITHLLTKHNRPAGNYFGTIHAKLWINKVSYTSTFQVLKKSNSADIQIGSRFLRSDGFMELGHISSVLRPVENKNHSQN